jgi:hypothetical protein
MAALANAKHEEVALAYMGDPRKIGWRAYRKVYSKSSQRAAEAAFSRLLRNAEFSARVAELQAQAAEVAVMAAREVLIELSRIGRANMADFVQAFGCGDPVAAVDQLTPEQTAALGEVTVEQFMDGAGAREVRRIKFKLIAKIPALELLGKHYRLFVERHVRDLGAGVAERLAAAIARVEGRGRSADRQVSRPRGDLRAELHTRTSAFGLDDVAIGADGRRLFGCFMRSLPMSRFWRVGRHWRASSILRLARAMSSNASLSSSGFEVGRNVFFGLQTVDGIRAGRFESHLLQSGALALTERAFDLAHPLIELAPDRRTLTRLPLMDTLSATRERVVLVASFEELSRDHQIDPSADRTLVMTLRPTRCANK